MAGPKVWKETFVYKYTLPAQLNAGVAVCVQNKAAAEALKKLPHNVLYIANLDSNCVLHIFLDDFYDSTKPDYVLYPVSTISIKFDEGVSYSSVWILNSDTVNNIAANDIKVRLSTSEYLDYDEVRKNA